MQYYAPEVFGGRRDVITAGRETVGGRRVLDSDPPEGFSRGGAGGVHVFD